MKRTKVPVLCVDDEPNVLSSLKVTLRKGYAVDTAESGPAALEAVGKKAYAVVLSDMRMPEMTGAELLGEVRRRAPDTVRMLLTGQTDLDSAVQAINDGQIFRFLTKPCPPPALHAAFEAATEQHRLLHAERELLEKTVRGSVEALTDLLALSHPTAFGRATRLKNRSRQVAEALEIENLWEIEIAAMLSQLGTVTLPDAIVDKRYRGERLSDEEKAMVAELPKVSASLIGRIPRLETVREAVLHQDDPFSEVSRRPEVPRAAHILKAVIDLDLLESEAVDPTKAIVVLRRRKSFYDPKILDALEKCIGSACATSEIIEVEVSGLRAGMTFVQDVYASDGTLLVAKDTAITEGLLRRIRNRAQQIKGAVRVSVEAGEALDRTG